LEEARRDLQRGGGGDEDETRDALGPGERGGERDEAAEAVPDEHGATEAECARGLTGGGEPVVEIRRLAGRASVRGHVERAGRSHGRDSVDRCQPDRRRRGGTVEEENRWRVPAAALAIANLGAAEPADFEERHFLPSTFGRP